MAPKVSTHARRMIANPIAYGRVHSRFQFPRSLILHLILWLHVQFSWLIFTNTVFIFTIKLLEIWKTNFNTLQNETSNLTLYNPKTVLFFFFASMCRSYKFDTIIRRTIDTIKSRFDRRVDLTELRLSIWRKGRLDTILIVDLTQLRVDLTEESIWHIYESIWQKGWFDTFKSRFDKRVDLTQLRVDLTEGSIWHIVRVDLTERSIWHN